MISQESLFRRLRIDAPMTTKREPRNAAKHDAVRQELALQPRLTNAQLSANLREKYGLEWSALSIQVWRYTHGLAYGHISHGKRERNAAIREELAANPRLSNAQLSSILKDKHGFDCAPITLERWRYKNGLAYGQFGKNAPAAITNKKESNQ